MTPARTAFATLIAFAMAATPALAAKKDIKTWTDPAAAAKEDPDFLVQGEYVGAIESEGKPDKKIGAQVIALGGGKFRLVMFSGGLPGQGKVERDKNEAEAQRNDKGEVVFEHPDGRERVVLVDGVAKLYTGDQLIATLPKAQRQSPTLGMKPPAGAVVLFDGTKESLDNWHKGAKMTDDGLLMQGVKSKKLHQDATIHVEFLLPYKPEARGQGRGNSGLYVQGRYETQMLDSFGLQGKHNECGGIYSTRDPDQNMCFPPLTWQTYDIDFTAAKFDAEGKKTANARMTVKLNGVVVQPDVECDHATTASPLKEGPEPGPIFLQNHGNPVRYRNIWFVPKN